jgi:hypothetical protein
MQARFVPFVDGLLAADNLRDSNLVLIGHGGLYLSMFPLVLANVDHEFASRQQFPNTGYVLAENGSQGLICREWCGAPVA